MAKQDTYTSEYFNAVYVAAEEAGGGPQGFWIAANDGAGWSFDDDTEFDAAAFFAEQGFDHVDDKVGVQTEEFICIFDEAHIVAVLSELDREYEACCKEHEWEARMAKFC